MSNSAEFKDRQLEDLRELKTRQAHTDEAIERLSLGLARTEQAVEQFSTTLNGVATAMTDTRNLLNSFASEHQALSMQIRNGSGKLDVKLFVTIVVPIGVFVAFLMAMWLQPIQIKQDGYQTLSGQVMQQLRADVDKINARGSDAAREKISEIDTQLRLLQVKVEP